MGSSLTKKVGKDAGEAMGDAMNKQTAQLNEATATFKAQTDKGITAFNTQTDKCITAFNTQTDKGIAAFNANADKALKVGAGLGVAHLALEGAKIAEMKNIGANVKTCAISQNAISETFQTETGFTALGQEMVGVIAYFAAGENAQYLFVVPNTVDSTRMHGLLCQNFPRMCFKDVRIFTAEEFMTRRIAVKTRKKGINRQAVLYFFAPVDMKTLSLPQLAWTVECYDQKMFVQEIIADNVGLGTNVIKGVRPRIEEDIAQNTGYSFLQGATSVGLLQSGMYFKTASGIVYYTTGVCIGSFATVTCVGAIAVGGIAAVAYVIPAWKRKGASPPSLPNVEVHLIEDPSKNIGQLTSSDAPLGPRVGWKVIAART
eukprot:g28230.t1